MENLFLLSDDQLRILLDRYSAWCEKNEGERNYADDQEQRSKELRQTLLNKEYLSKVSDAEWAKKIFGKE